MGHTTVIEQLRAVNSQLGIQRIGRLSVLALRVITGYLLLQLLPRGQLLHPFKGNLATDIALLNLVLGFRGGNLIHGNHEIYAVSDGRVIAYLGIYSLSPNLDNSSWLKVLYSGHFFGERRFVRQGRRYLFRANSLNLN